MPLLTRRGFTLVELLVALMLLGIVSMGIYQVLVSNQRIYQSQTQHIDLQQNIRAAAVILPAELREVDAADSDLYAIASDSISFRNMTGLSVICSPPPLTGLTTALAFTTFQKLTYGSRQVDAATDSLLVYDDGVNTTRSDDRWVPASLAADPTSLACPASAGSAAGWSITANGDFTRVGALNAVNAIRRGAPVRSFTPVTYRLYQAADGNYYLGYRQAAATIQPLIGPLYNTATTPGVTFTYYDSSGTVTADRTKVAQIVFTLRAQTAQPIRQPSGAIENAVDSITTRVTLRNNAR